MSNTLVRELINLCGIESVVETSFNGLVKAVFELFDIEEGSTEEALIKDTAKKHIPEYIDSLEALYAKHFTFEEVQALVAFYKSDIGQKLVESMPLLMKQGSAAFEPIARRIQFEVRTELQNRVGIDPGQNTFTLYWKDGKREVLKGKDFLDAIRKAGYGKGAIKALDFTADGDNKEYGWSKTTQRWNKV